MKLQMLGAAAAGPVIGMSTISGTRSLYAKWVETSCRDLKRGKRPSQRTREPSTKCE